MSTSKPTVEGIHYAGHYFLNLLYQTAACYRDRGLYPRDYPSYVSPAKGNGDIATVYFSNQLNGNQKWAIVKAAPPDSWRTFICPPRKHLEAAGFTGILVAHGRAAETHAALSNELRDENPNRELYRYRRIALIDDLVDMDLPPGKSPSGAENPFNFRYCKEIPLLLGETNLLRLLYRLAGVKIPLEIPSEVTAFDIFNLKRGPV